MSDDRMATELPHEPADALFSSPMCAPRAWIGGRSHKSSAVRSQFPRQLYAFVFASAVSIKSVSSASAPESTGHWGDSSTRPPTFTHRRPLLSLLRSVWGPLGRRRRSRRLCREASHHTSMPTRVGSAQDPVISSRPNTNSKMPTLTWT